MNIEIPASVHEVLGLGAGNGRGPFEWTREASGGPHLDRGILLGRQAYIGDRPMEMGSGHRPAQPRIGARPRQGVGRGIK